MAMLEEIGTWEWAKQTGGRLSPDEQQALMQQAVAQAGAMTAQIGAAPMDMSKIRIPDSRTARQAESLIAELCQPALLNHCYRTYLWGSLLAQHDAVPVPDEEAFYVASLLHDLGLTEKHFCRHADVHCFAVEGAMAAGDFLAGQGWEQTRRDVVAEAICLHLNLLVELSRGPLAHYLSAGAKCDVVGLRAADLPQLVIEDVLQRYPGEGFEESFSHLLAAEAQARPASRIGFVLANFPPAEIFPLGKKTAS